MMRPVALPPCPAAAAARLACDPSAAAAAAPQAASRAPRRALSFNPVEVFSVISQVEYEERGTGKKREAVKLVEEEEEEEKRSRREKRREL